MIVALALAGVSAQAPAQPAPQSAPPPAPAAQPALSGYVPERVFDTRRNAFIDFEVMLAQLATDDVVLVGEQHDDPNTHRLESALLEGLLRRHVPVTLSLEMFERDVQPALDGYLAGRQSEAVFLADARPWPRYATDYRALVELARRESWPVVAANVPRTYASAIAKNGLPALEALPAADRQFAAKEVVCPEDAYFARFAATMGEHPGPEQGSGASADAARRATIERYYQSQCVKDETMAEAIAGAVERRPGGAGLVVHVTGAFHADFGTGTAERVRRRLPARRMAIVSVLPVDNLDAISPAGDDLKRADYLVYTAGR